MHFSNEMREKTSESTKRITERNERVKMIKILLVFQYSHKREFNRVLHVAHWIYNAKLLLYLCNLS